MAKRSAMWEQKKYTLLRNEINLDNQEQQKAKEEANRAANEA